MKAQLTNLGLDTSGLKAALAARLLEHITKADDDGEEKEKKAEEVKEEKEEEERKEDEAATPPPEPPTQTEEESHPGEKRKEPETVPAEPSAEGGAEAGEDTETHKKARVEETNGTEMKTEEVSASEPAAAPVSTSRWGADNPVAAAATDLQQGGSAGFVLDSKPVAATPAPVKKAKGAEIYVGNLDPYTTEEDLRALFSQLGEVTEIRLKMRQQQGGRNFSFVRFSDKEAAARAVAELDRRLELHGRVLTISYTAVNDKLRFSNVPTHWRADQIEEALVAQGCDGVYEIEMPLAGDGISNQGFCVIEFDNHPAAQRAYRLTTTAANGVTMDGRRLTVEWPDGVDRSTQQQQMQRAGLSNQLDDAMQVKNLYVGGVPVDVTEQEMRAVFSVYGEIDNVRLAGQAPNARRPDFAFINYRDRDSAIRALEALRVEPKAQIRGHALEVEMARPPKNSMMQQQRSMYGQAAVYAQGLQQAQYAQGTGYTAGGSYYQQTQGGGWQQQPTEAAYGIYAQQLAAQQGWTGQQGYSTTGVQQPFAAFGQQQQQQWTGTGQQQTWNQTGTGQQSYGRF